MHKKGLSIIIPTYNEADNIPDLISRTVKALEQTSIPYEIIFVDDHSTDDTHATIHAHKGKHPVFVHAKVGKKGKGYSILEGYTKAQYTHIAMLDADLQYPPEIIPDLYAKAVEHGFSVATRKTYTSTFARKVASRLNAFFFGRLLLDLHTDIQSGLKIFPAEVFERVNKNLISAWAIDIPLVFTAYELGHDEGHVDIDFTPRVSGTSNVRFLHTAFEIAWGALKTKSQRRNVHLIQPTDDDSMLGSGMTYRRKRFITHTTLTHKESALVTFTYWQKLFLIAIATVCVWGIVQNPLSTVIVGVATLSAIYFIDVVFNLFVILKSLHFPPEIVIPEDSLARINEHELPVYSILCPLYKEARVLPQFIEAMNALDWPKNKLDVLLLLEADDTHTIEVAKAMKLPLYFRVVIVPYSQPKTKPKAANFGLSMAKGEYVVVYDAEDKPDPLQLKKAYIAFSEAPKNIACLQAKLNYYNPHDNFLTRLFTAEYSLWFDVTLPGLQSIATTIPLGGTSNHFRTEKLRNIHGWDAFNVTEDCDLGARLFKAGYQTAIIDSTTLEEANGHVGNWFRQRSRWIKGYFQTYLVHMRNPLQFARDHGIHALIFQLTVGGKLAFMLINPFLWIITISYFALYRYVGPTIESIYPATVFYMAAFSLVFGNFVYLYNYMIGCAKRNHWELIKYIFLVPFYWLMISWAAGIALFQLFFKPHYWEKTIHGLHIAHEEEKKKREIMKIESSATRARKLQKFADLAGSKFLSGGILIIASFIGNILNFLYSSYLGRTITIEEFGVISLIGSFIYIAQVPLGALSRSVTHKSAYFLGQYGTPIQAFWTKIRKQSYLFSIAVSILWLLLTPFFQSFFKVDSILPFVLFTPVWFIGTLASVDGGFLGGSLRFNTLAVLTVTEAVCKLFFTVILVEQGLSTYVYAAIPLSMTFSFAFGWWFAKHNITDPHIAKIPESTLVFPKKFFATSILSTLTGITYLSLDLVLAKHYLSPQDAGAYSFLSLVGKMVYLLGDLFSSFINPLVSRNLGAGKKSRSVFVKLLILILLANTVGVVTFGILGFFTVPLLWGSKAAIIIPYLPTYTIAMALFSMSAVIISYHQVREEHLFPIAGFFLGLLEIVGIYFFHDSIETIAKVALMASSIMFGVIILLDRFYGTLVDIYRNGIDLFGLFGRLPELQKLPDNKKRILIFNWRDLRHKWSGGAEVYIHELAKRWIRMGHEVTVFCGNDGHSSRYETIDGVRIIRRGGFYFVYLWAFLYYHYRLRGKYDIIIDSENGIPFFSPLYATEKVYLLIHHVHQEVFRKSLRPPLSWLAMCLEKRVMPVVYRKTEVITVSPSSKADILAHKLTKTDPHVIYNGVDLTMCKPGKKSATPLVLYLGRLTTIKSLSIFIQAAKKILIKIPDVQFIIAGDGPDKKRLVNIVKKLGLEKHITFEGKVSESEKITLFQRAWVFVNPSLMEGWGITTIEANACGTPVVASNVAGLQDAVHNPHSGFLVPYGNIEEFSLAISKLIEDKSLRTRMSQDSLVWAKKFDWEKSAVESINLLQKE